MSVKKDSCVTLCSDEGNNWVLSQPLANTRHFSVLGDLTLENITIDGHGRGGGIVANYARLTARKGVLIKDCFASANGGGVNLLASTFTMSDSKIIGNRSGASGGGLFFSSGSLFIMEKGMISGNTANYGGGMYVFSSAVQILSSQISGNSALYGGSIYIRSVSGEEIKISADTIFSCNKAESAYNPPANAKELYPYMQFKCTTITEHLLNNYDVNYMLGTIFDAHFHVSYTANGGSGAYEGPRVEVCDDDRVVSVQEAGIIRTGYDFIGWNTNLDGQGEEYLPQDKINVNRDITLYAQWRAKVYTVTYNANGGQGDYIDNGVFDSEYTVLSPRKTNISRMMFVLTGWNTQPTGDGETYFEGDSFVVKGNSVLYAQWRKITIKEMNNLLLTAAAIEQLGFAELLNSQGDMLSLSGGSGIGGIINLNKNVQKTLRGIKNSELLLQTAIEKTDRLKKGRDN